LYTRTTARPPRAALFPSTTLFRSNIAEGVDLPVLPAQQAAQAVEDVRLVVDQLDSDHAGFSVSWFCCVCRSGSGCVTGSVIRNRVPCPGSLCTSISPLCFLMMLKDSDSPNPVPLPMPLVVKNGSKMR